MRKFYLFFSLLLVFITASGFLFSQTVKPDTLSQFKTIVAGPEYKASGFKQWLWGSNYRNEWTTPVTVKLLWLDTAQSSFKNITAGTRDQMLNLHIQNAEGKEFLLRPVNKTLGKNLPEIFRKTFIDYRLKDGGSASNPYVGAPIPALSEKVKIYHTNVTYLYVPSQPALGQYNNAFSNNLYIFEELVPGNFENYITTEQLLDTLKNNTDISIDEKAFIKARLFDMFLNDWDGREKNWLWGKTKINYKTVYIPLPVNRDQAFSNHNGFLSNAAKNAAGFKYIQKFNNNIPNLKYFNYQEKDIDRRLLNQATLSEWQTEAKELQQSLTDEIIEDAVRRFPPEIYAETGKDIIAKLKERRKHIVEWATEYYKFISKEVEIPGSFKNEIFNIQRVNNKETLIQVFNADNTTTPFYSRTFKSSETKQIRLFGLTGNDIYHVSGSAANKINIKIIDGINSDSVVDVAAGNNNVCVYATDIQTNNSNNIHIIHDTTFRSYRYDWYNYDKKEFTPLIFYSNEDRLYAGLTYRIRTYKWGKLPFALNQTLSLHYSLLEGAPSITYRALFPRPVLHSDLTLLANYDDIRWQFYFGIGNDTKFEDKYKLKYYTTRTRQWIFQPQLTKTIGRSTLSVFADIQGIKVIADSARFIAKPSVNTVGYNWQTFAGGGLSYSFQHLNDPIVPVKGVFFNATASGEQNLNDKSSHYMKYSGAASFYIPLVSKFSLNIRTGASTVAGNPEFYQYASLGGTIFRGVARDRFRGKTAFYNTNDLRFISPVHSYFFNGKAGFLAFVDNGRVWMPGEKSDTWHVAYGGGVLVAPFNFLYADATYGRYKKESTIQVRLILLTQR